MFAMFVGTPLFIILVVGATPAVWFLVAMAGRSNVKKTQNLMATGARATGTIPSVSDTGMTINDNPRVALTLQVQPDNGAARVHSSRRPRRCRASRSRAQGDQVAVWYDRGEPERSPPGSRRPPSPRASRASRKSAIARSRSTLWSTIGSG